MTLSSGDVLELATRYGATASQFEGWYRQGVFVPAAGGTGSGNHRRWTLMQAVGIVIAYRVFASERGCCATYLGKVARAFSEFTREGLLNEFAVGHRWLVTIQDSRPILSSERGEDRVDVEETYHAVVTGLDQIHTPLRKRLPGRVRGLTDSEAL